MWRKNTVAREVGRWALSVTAIIVFFLGVHVSAGPLASRKLLEKSTAANASSAKPAPIEVPLNSTLGGLYAALNTLEESDMQDLDFAKTLLILEEHEIQMAAWYQKEGTHEGLLNISSGVLESRPQETKLLKQFLQKLDSRNPFMPGASLKIEPLTALVPLKTTAFQLNVASKDVESNSIPVIPGIVKLGSSDNVLASATRAGSLHDAGLRGAAFRYQNRQKGRPAGSVLPGSVHGIMLSHDTDADFATIMTIVHEGMKSAAYAELDKGDDPAMKELAKEVLQRALSDLEVLRRVMKERMQVRYGVERRAEVAASNLAPTPSV